MQRQDQLPAFSPPKSTLEPGPLADHNPIQPQQQPSFQSNNRPSQAPTPIPYDSGNIEPSSPAPLNHTNTSANTNANVNANVNANANANASDNASQDLPAPVSAVSSRKPSLSENILASVTAAASTAVETARHLVLTDNEDILQKEESEGMSTVEDINSSSFLRRKSVTHGLEFKQRRLSVQKNKKSTNLTTATVSPSTIAPVTSVLTKNVEADVSPARPTKPGEARNAAAKGVAQWLEEAKAEQEIERQKTRTDLANNDSNIGHVGVDNSSSRSNEGNTVNSAKTSDVAIDNNINRSNEGNIVNSANITTNNNANPNAVLTQAFPSNDNSNGDWLEHSTSTGLFSGPGPLDGPSNNTERTITAPDTGAGAAPTGAAPTAAAPTAAAPTAAASAGAAPTGAASAGAAPTGAAPTGAASAGAAPTGAASAGAAPTGAASAGTAPTSAASAGAASVASVMFDNNPQIVRGTPMPIRNGPNNQLHHRTSSASSALNQKNFNPHRGSVSSLHSIRNNTIYVASHAPESARYDGLGVDQPSVSQSYHHHHRNSSSGLSVDKPLLVGEPRDLRERRKGGLSVDVTPLQDTHHHDVHVPHDHEKELANASAVLTSSPTTLSPARAATSGVTSSPTKATPTRTGSLGLHTRRESVSGLNVDMVPIPSKEPAGPGSNEETFRANTYNSGYMVDKARSAEYKRNALGVDVPAFNSYKMGSVHDPYINIAGMDNRPTPAADQAYTTNISNNATRYETQDNGKGKAVLRPLCSDSPTGGSNNANRTGHSTDESSSSASHYAPHNDNLDNGHIVTDVPTDYTGPLPQVGPGEEIVWVKKTIQTDYYDNNEKSIQTKEKHRSGFSNFFDKLRGRSSNRNNATIDKGKSRT
ncbi:hypothetical protein BG004_000510 [Podila humilis]|nr:hypothetical protein BG004_000510 [Podila humilis]